MSENSKIARNEQGNHAAPCSTGSDLRVVLETCIQNLRPDEPLWSEFILRTQPLIAGVITKSVRRWTGMVNPSLVDDLVQDTYLKLCANDYKALREFECDHESALFGFLKVVASNVVHDHFRGHCSQKRGSGHEPEALEDVSHKRACGDSVEDKIEQRILLREIDSCLKERYGEQTSSRDADIFWLYYRDGLTARAIAQRPDVRLTVKGVESTIHRLTRHVRVRLSGRKSKITRRTKMIRRSKTTPRSKKN